MTRDYQFDGVHNAAAWRTAIHNYLMSRAPEMDHLLRIIESNEDGPAVCSALHVQTVNWLPIARLQFLAAEFWGFLNLNLTGEARPPFNNVRDREGFEAWRKCVKLVRSRFEIRKMDFRPGLKDLRRQRDWQMSQLHWTRGTRISAISLKLADGH